jgi:hypothetical protein
MSALEFTPFRAAHLTYLVPQEAQRRDHAALLGSGAAELMESPMALTAWHKSRCLGMAGLLQVHPHRALAWALLSDAAAPHMLAITRKVKRVVALSPWRRVEITVAADFIDGQRFARALGATLETPEPLKAYGVYGNDEYMYSIVRT